MWRLPRPSPMMIALRSWCGQKFEEQCVGVFGEKLRKQREQRGLELDAISNTTKISTRMLRALEDEHFDQLPGGVFNKGFVRAYARQIGLDEEEAVADYLTALRESQIQQQSILPDFRAPAAKPNPPEPLPSHNLPANNEDHGDDHVHELHREDRRKQGRRHEDRRDDDRSHHRVDPLSTIDSTAHASAGNPAADRFRQKYPAGDPAEPAHEPSVHIPWGKLALALVLVTLALAFWNFRRHAQPTPARAAASPIVAASNQSPALASAPASKTTQPSAPPTSTTVASASPGKNLPAGAVSPAPISAATTQARTNPPAKAAPASTLTRNASAAAPVLSPTTSANAFASKLPANAPEPNSKPPATHVAVPAAAPKPPNTLNLLVRAEETTWVALVADGKPIAHETLIAPAQTSIRASREIVVKAGNAAGISFVLNGQEIPAQGNEGEVKTYIFDATGVHVAPQNQPAATNH